MHRSEISAASDDTPRQAELPYPMSAWTWEKHEAAAAWMVVPTGEAGLGLQVCVHAILAGSWCTTVEQLESSIPSCCFMAVDVS